MTSMRYLIFLLCLINCSLAFSQRRTIDVQHYRFEISLTDASDTLRGKAFITVKFLQPASSLTFDLTSTDSAGKGMIGYHALENGKSLASVHARDKLQLKLAKPAKQGEVRT